MKRLDKNILAARMGLEKESLRVDRRARLAQTSHPFPDDADLDVDFSGNQLEFVTDVCDSADEVWEALRRLHRPACWKNGRPGRSTCGLSATRPMFRRKGRIRPWSFAGRRHGRRRTGNI